MPSKLNAPSQHLLSRWILMLLIWNIALLGIALFYLVRINREPPIPLTELAAACAEVVRTSAPSPSL